MRGGLVVLAVLAAACGADRDPRPPAWSYISSAIILPSCATASCHSTHTSTAGLQLDQGASQSYILLVGGGWVKPGDPTGSKLMHLLRGDQIWRMPPDGPLPDADIALIEQWILDGASPE